MRIEEIHITEMDNINVLTDERVYAIVADTWDKGKYKMKPIADCEIGDLFSSKLSLIRIVE